MSKLLRVFSRIGKFNSMKNSTAVMIKEVPSNNALSIRQKQEFYQREDGNMPSYLKGGMRDKHLFNFTLLLLGLGIMMSLETVLRLVTGRKN